MGDHNILEVRGLWKNFGSLAAVAGVDLGFREKELTSVIGPNGAGKTTLFNVITGKLRPSRGGIFFKDKEITRLKPFRIAQLGISRIFQITNLFPELTAHENIRVAILAHMKKNKKMLSLDRKLNKVTEETDRIIELIGLSGKENIPCGVLSHGDQRLIEVGLALALQPTLLLLDEPTGGMGSEETDEMIKFIRGLKEKQDIMILLVEHDMSVVFSVSDRIVVMHQGMVIADGTPEEIRESEKVKEAYLGEE